MKIHELEIHNLRGIQDLTLKPEGNNIVIWGPNGSGKSAVVDAIDFLLTGQISRLTGKGMGGINRDKYGPHIRHKPEDARVRAVVQLHGMENLVEIERCMKNHNTCKYDKKSLATNLENLEIVMAIAQRGQHVLTRREILKYITADASTRAKEIQDLLNLSEVENIRKELVSVENDLEEELQVAERDVDKAKGAVNTTLNKKTFRRKALLGAVNKYRKILGGENISTYHTSILKKGLIEPAAISGKRSINIAHLSEVIKSIKEVTLQKNQEKIAQQDDELRRLLEIIRSNSQLSKTLPRLHLTKLGLDLIDETGTCPLCGTEWDLNELQKKLNKQLSAAKKAFGFKKKIDTLAKKITIQINLNIPKIEEFIKAAKKSNLSRNDIAILQSWLGNLQNLSEFLSAPLERYPDPSFSPTQVRQMLAPPGISQLLTGIHKKLKAVCPKITPEQTAWDNLTRLEVNLKRLEHAEKKIKNAKLSQKRASILLKKFYESRDAVLGKLYKDVKVRFVCLYRKLHPIKEDKFNAEMKHTESKLDFKVAFHNHGLHPPHALHSEGHQDSMGLCLYFALVEQLNKDAIDLLILDDVVLSVDANHRKNLCRLLRTQLNNRQLIITTHDKTWVKQLHWGGVVTTRGIFEFYHWDIDSGSPLNAHVSMWEKIDTALKNHDIPGAAARLRRGAEEFLGMVCDALHAKVRYKLNLQGEFGDLFEAAWSQYQKRLKEAKNAAKSWDKNDENDELEKLHKKAQEIHKRFNDEQKAVNPNVHYNYWADFNEQDFRSVVEAFQEFFNLFLCDKCHGMLFLSTKGSDPVAVSCNCGETSWKLIRKEKDNKIGHGVVV
jgi:DNA repair exonuclease SbcCD ATPase subunit